MMSESLSETMAALDSLDLNMQLIRSTPSARIAVRLYGIGKK